MVRLSEQAISKILGKVWRLSLKRREFRLSDANDESQVQVRLVFACSSLEQTSEISILGNYKGHSLKRRVTRLSEASSGQIFNYDSLNPFSSKNPILIPQTPKLIYRNVYGFTKQQSIRNISYKHHQTHIIQQQ